MNDIVKRLRGALVREGSSLETDAAYEIERLRSYAEGLVDYGRYYRDILLRIAGDYPTPATLAEIALGWTIHRDGCTEDMECECEIPAALEPLEERGSSAHALAALDRVLHHLPELWGDEVVEGQIMLKVDAGAGVVDNATEALSRTFIEPHAESGEPK